MPIPLLRPDAVGSHWCQGQAVPLADTAGATVARALNNVKNRRNYYRILNVQPDAPPEVIRSSYRTMMQSMRMHPDLGGDTTTAAIINEAYHTLIDERQRRVYDREHRDSDWARHTHRFHAGHATVQEGAGRCHFCRFVHVSAAFAEPPECCVNCRSPLGLLRLPEPESNDRRRMLRLSRRFEMNFFTHWPQAAPCHARTRDVSPAGVCFHCASALAPGQMLKVESELLDAVACVVRSTLHHSEWEVGARFLSVRFAHSRGSFVACWV